MPRRCRTASPPAAPSWPPPRSDKHYVKLIAALLAAWAAVITWLCLDHPLGLRFAMGIWPVPPGTPWTYQLESGFLPALTVLTLLSAVGTLYHLRNCHHEGCLRLGRHHIKGTPWCDVHQEEGRLTETTEDVLREILEELKAMRTERDLS